MPTIIVRTREVDSRWSRATTPIYIFHLKPIKDKIQKAAQKNQQHAHKSLMDWKDWLHLNHRTKSILVSRANLELKTPRLCPLLYNTARVWCICNYLSNLAGPIMLAVLTKNYGYFTIISWVTISLSGLLFSCDLYKEVLVGIHCTAQ